MRGLAVAERVLGSASRERHAVKRWLVRAAALLASAICSESGFTLEC
jgi:hypothetical protein